MMGGFGMGYGMGGFGMIFMIVIWALIVTGIVFLIRWVAVSTNAQKSVTGGGETPVDILKKRYARGEIDKVEFEEKMKMLS
jgi:putative membrane protein